MTHHTFIPDTLKQWIATNIALHQPADELVKVLSDNRFSVDLASVEVETAFLHPYVEPAQSLVLVCNVSASLRRPILHPSRPKLSSAISAPPRFHPGFESLRWK